MKPVFDLPSLSAHSTGAPNRDAEFSNKASNFVEHGQKLAETASLVANFGAPSADKQLLDQINATGQEVCRLFSHA